MADVPIDIDHVSQLARLALTEEEAARFSGQFSRLFEFIAELQALDVDAISATAQVIPLKNVMREDVAQACLPRDIALENAPAREGPYFKTPRILDGES
ncbi:MAG: Asp-tRNA(Asn)/Glu-tRNA(Gln) amidotransferase subunit GatC [Candidatus Eremiobacteraeota bacterium]|nr:Asp-tRNA(Asn)/Glu-tRNA(Gln) amidotransferase subunit GatC [Candidatus Eremiobacteraeota bacterium]MBV8262241.1 Asp-tRNA(Asn)/Glu-tRNA(Gln) amidotransferase subunit GatC [Candidatus Eremiobacteraeota bacterium]MBV8339522.1 Asp-tRNA(Asn)/Glu-tRNA(Gln) amidotransferase subunit GatC [Candidatus Eremiobacteraeota bacterium]MBV8461078.1 Asp-tRNA(Asn)/Glu-tRNA(Gln) amidotransferase subunit GatC [Candidatus Eremiobacteraeota bacterium]MBV8594831.1 Asp-tRNA(Asn)/Glu-tRNA(Gln) amidotransferase subunit